MILGVLKEPPPETRVSLLPEHISLLKKNNIEVIVEPGAGALAFATDESYKNAGASIASREEIINKSDVALAIHLPSIEDVALFPKVMAGIYQPFYNEDLIAKYLEAGVCLFSIDMIPRTSRAQAMDVLSSQASIAGYKAVLLAADLLPKYFPMLMTAAGSIPPAKVLILGAGVAGLQAIATARRLGAVVEVFDTRPAVKEEVMSLGAKFIEVEGAADASKAGGYAVQQSAEFLQRQQEKIAASIAKSDVVITTAQIFGKKAPVLVTEEMIANMKNGSVIIDLAASTGGNTSLTRNNETVNYNGVTIVGNSNLPSRMPYDASKLYGKNMVNFLKLLVDEQGNIHTDIDDDLVKGALIKQPVHGIINS
jgi:H+-translocating NAD(P) transhydrogenase subunit alpha